jgi:hypothetical protein
MSLTLDELVGLQRTYAYSSPAVLGDIRTAFEADLRAALTAIQPEGPFVANLQAALIIGRRPHARREGQLWRLGLGRVQGLRLVHHDLSAGSLRSLGYPRERRHNLAGTPRAIARMVST